MIYFYWYLAIGVVVLLVVFMSHRISKASQTDFKTALRYAIYPEQKTLGHRILKNMVVPVLASVALAIVWPIILYMKGEEIITKKTESARAKENEFAVKLADMLQQMTVKEIEKLERVHDPMGAVPDLPFGHINSAWERFRDGLDPQDAIWTFSTNWTSPWGRKELRAGYVAVRAEAVGAYFLTTRKRIDEG